MSDRAYRRMFVGAALWNVAGTLVMIVFTPWIFHREGLTPPQPAVFYGTWLAMCIVFGGGYYAVARDLSRNHAVVGMGIAGKAAFAAVFIYHYAVAPGQVPHFFWVPVVGDLYFIVRFAMFLRFARAGRAARSEERLAR